MESNLLMLVLTEKFSADRCHRLQMSLQTHHNSEMEARGRTQFTANAYHLRITLYMSYVVYNHSFDS